MSQVEFGTGGWPPISTWITHFLRIFIFEYLPLTSMTIIYSTISPFVIDGNLVLKNI
jgi:hypothetical protein